MPLTVSEGPTNVLDSVRLRAGISFNGCVNFTLRQSISTTIFDCKPVFTCFFNSCNTARDDRYSIKYRESISLSFTRTEQYTVLYDNANTKK